jgi:hypothetical protein
VLPIDKEGIFVRRIHLLLAALAIAVASFAAFSGAAIADDWDDDWHHDGNVVWHTNNGDWDDDDWDNDDWDDYWWLWANDWDDDDWNHDSDNSWWWANDRQHGFEGPVGLMD